MGPLFKGTAGLLLACLLVLILTAHTACSSEGTARIGDDGGVSVAAKSEALTLPPINAAADTSLRQGFQYANDGTGTNLSVSSVAGAGQRSLLRFSQTAIATAVGSQALYRAQVELTIKTISEGWGGGELAVHAMTRTWPEGNGTFSPPGSHGPSWRCADDTDTSTLGNLVNNCTPANLWGMDPSDPDPIPFNPIASDTARLYGNGTTVLRFDVTADVRRFLTGDPNHGFIIKDTAGALHGAWVNFGSRETTTPPKLILDVGPDQCPTDPNKVQPGRCGCGTPETDTDADGHPDCVEPTLVPVADTTLRLAVPNGNDGLGMNLGVTSASVVSLERTLIRFDQAELQRLAAGCSVTNAELELKVSGIAVGWNGGAIEIRRMNRHWPEGVGLDVSLGAHGPSWRCADDRNTSVAGNASNDCAAFDLWGMRTTDPGPSPFVSTVTDTEPIFTATTTQVRFDVTADVQSFLTGTANYGWIVKGTDSPLSGAWVNFGSRETDTGPVLRLTLDTGGDCGDRDGDGLSDDSEINDAEPWTDPDVFNGMRARSANRCHAAPTCAAIDTVAEVNACTTPTPRETKNQAGGWSWQNPTSADLCSPGYGFRPEWSVCGVDWQVDWQGFIKLDNGGQHCFRVSGDTNGACGSLFFNNATSGITIASGAQCFQIPAGVYPIRWFYETTGAPKTEFRINYCYGNTQTCTPTEVIPNRLLRPEVCPAGSPCSPFCPCDGGVGTCTTDADCTAEFRCSPEANGPRHGKARGTRVCTSPSCNRGVDILNCGAGSLCGSCENVIVCTANSDCPAGEVCGFGAGAHFQASAQDVCIPSGCLTDPVATGCGDPRVTKCGTCPCASTCASKSCGDDPFACSELCTGFCDTREPGCKSDSDCPVDNACIFGGGPRIGLPTGTNVCLPSICTAPGRHSCGTTSSPCGQCPAPPPGVCDGIQCGNDAVYGVQCGNPDCGPGLACQTGQCVDRFTPDELAVAVTPRNGQGQDFMVTPLPPPNLRPETVPGALAGNFAVSDRGAATYSINITVPPARAGLEPQVSLNYDGNSPNGLAGIGWSIGGLSSISRCPRTAADFGLPKPVSYTSDDKLCLDGLRLIRVAGPVYGTTGAVYATEIDRHDRIVQLRDEARGFAYFRVFKKDGRIFTYGRQPNAHLYRGTGGVIRAWALSLIQDRTSNVIAYRYGKFEDLEPQREGRVDDTPETVEFFPLEIGYGGVLNDVVSIAGRRSVKFHYNDVGDESRSDYMSGYTPGGARIARTRLLKSITTQLGGEVVRTYDLTYERAPLGVPSSDPGIERIASISECGHKYGEKVCKPPTRFQYTDQRGFDPLRPARRSIVRPRPTDGKGLIVLDWNGDGRDDILVHGERGESPHQPLPQWKIILATGSTSDPFLELPSNLEPIPGYFNCITQASILDYDLDGKDDIFDLCVSKIWFGDSAGTPLGSGRQGVTTVPFFRADDFGAGFLRALTDLTGDGIEDLFLCGSWYYPRVPGGDFLPARGHTSEPNETGCSDYNPRMLVADVDGDGVEDILKSQFHSPILARYVPQQDGSAHWVPLIPHRISFSSIESRRFLDVNGDGLKDYLAADKLFINRGNDGTIGGIFAPPVPVFGALTGRYQDARYPHLAGILYDHRPQSVGIDYNGDGFEDLLTHGRFLDRAKVADIGQAIGIPMLVPDINLANPQLLVPPEPIPTPQTIPVGTHTLADVDGDGSLDLVYLALGGSVHGHLSVRHGLFGRENLLTRVTDGLGKRIDILYGDTPPTRTYTPASICTQPADGPTSKCLKRVGPLVSSYEISFENSNGTPFEDRRYHLRYEDAREGLYGRGWLGFTKRTIEEFVPGTVFPLQATQIFQDDLRFDENRRLYPFAGLETRRVVTTASAQSKIERERTSRQVTTANLWDTQHSQLGGFFPFVELTFELEEDINSSGLRFPILTRATGQEVDDLGNVVFEGTQILQGSQPLASLTKSTDFDTSQSRIDDWLISLPLRQSTSEALFQGSNQTPPVNRVTTFTYDDVGLLESVTRQPDAPENSSERQVTRYFRAADNFRTLEAIRVTGSWTDAQGAVFTQERTTEVQYDSDKIFPEHVKRLVVDGPPNAPDGFLLTDVRYDPRDGTLLSSIDPAGIGDQWGYDEFGQVTAYRSAAESVDITYADAVTDVTQILAVHPRMEIQARSSTGAGSTRRIDGLGRVVQTETVGLKGGVILQEIFYLTGNLVALESRPHLRGVVNQGIVTHERDERLRPKRSVFPNGTDVEFLYATANTVLPAALPQGGGLGAGEVSVSGSEDARNNRSIAVSDFRGNPLRTIDASSSVTRYAYGPFGVLVQITDAHGNITQMLPDELGRIIEHTDSDTGTRRVRYTAFDEPFTQTDEVTAGVPRTTRYSYDPLGRIQTIVSSDGTTSFAYDFPGDNAVGRLVEMQSPNQHSERYTYEPKPADGDPMTNRGFVKSTARVILGNTFTTTLNYNAKSLLASVEYPPSPGPGPGGTTIPNAPFVVNYEYDAFGNIQAATEHEPPPGQQTLRDYWRLNEAFQGHRIAVESFGNGVRTTYGYEPHTGRIGRLETNGPGPGAPLFQSLRFENEMGGSGYDPNGNLVARRLTFKNVGQPGSQTTSETFTYDALDRLTHQSRAGVSGPIETLSYDAIGNIQSKLMSGTYNYTVEGEKFRPHAVQTVTTSTGPLEYRYDEAGNVKRRSGPGVQGGSQQTEYTSFNLPRLVTFGENGAAGQIQYEYDARAKRVAFTVNNPGGSEQRIYPGSAYERQTTVDAGGPVERHLYKVTAAGKQVAQVVREVRAGAAAESRRYLHQDQLASSQLITDEAGNLSHVQQFDVFGGTSQPTSGASDPASKQIRAGFTGHESDFETGLINMGGRIYDPRIARFLQADPPMAESPFSSQRLNRYSYVANNPLSAVDPSGFQGSPSFRSDMPPAAPPPPPPSGCRSEACFAPPPPPIIINLYPWPMGSAGRQESSASSVKTETRGGEGAHAEESSDAPTAAESAARAESVNAQAAYDALFGQSTPAATSGQESMMPSLPANFSADISDDRQLPSNPVGYYLSHGSYPGSSIVQNDRTLGQMQWTASWTSYVYTVLATGGYTLGMSTASAPAAAAVGLPAAGGEALAAAGGGLAAKGAEVAGSGPGGPSVFYRIITSTGGDGNFLSNAAKGLAPRGPELTNPLLHRGISVFETLEGAAARVPILQRGGHNVLGIAELRIPAGASGVGVTKTLGAGHYTMTGAPGVLSSHWFFSWTAF